MKKINIAEFLKDCPKGMELDCTMFDNVKLEYIDDRNSICYPIKATLEDGAIIALTKYGQYVGTDSAKCIIFPKGKTTWEGFVPPCKFKDGDIVFYDETIAIFKEWGDSTLFRSYVIKYLYNDYAIVMDAPLFGKYIRKEMRLATEEEKEKLFQAIKDNGYHWNAETKTLEKLIKPWTIQDAKDGDVLATHECLVLFKKLDGLNIKCYCTYHFMGHQSFYVDTLQNKDAFHPATEEQRDFLFQKMKEAGYKWNPENKTLEKLVEPWTIQDAKDGDVLAFDDETIVIFKDLYNETSFHSYCHIEEGIFTISKEDMPDWWEGKGFYPATKEQRDLLFQKMKEASYKWNAETKTLEKLPKFKVGDKITDKNKFIYRITEATDKGYKLHDLKTSFITFEEANLYFVKVVDVFDIATLKPFDKVLVRNTNNGRWCGQFYMSYYGNEEYPFECTYNCWKQCIPYEGNEYLLDTTNDCDEFYKNW